MPVVEFSAEVTFGERLTIFPPGLSFLLDTQELIAKNLPIVARAPWSSDRGQGLTFLDDPLLKFADPDVKAGRFDRDLLSRWLVVSKATLKICNELTIRTAFWLAIGNLMTFYVWKAVPAL